MARSPAGEPVLTRVVRVLDAFEQDGPALTVSQIARRADLPVATAHRLVSELVEMGPLERDSDRLRKAMATASGCRRRPP
ncbi:helix-turn-helix domain-containing protein [Allosalinactinospora lopnorensis]|uniref:helix-turn-helix domain-containing protein n=1 Tax=Allosalinactinospora lopnorensis TaxID=1352348 RepID=UPI0009E1C858|nr:helix-turn-helix domain-containing protein [Allosalinactinospora lopnorensis]